MVIVDIKVDFSFKFRLKSFINVIYIVSKFTMILP